MMSRWRFNKIFVCKLVLISILIYSAYITLYILSDVEPSSQVMHSFTNAVLRRKPKVTMLKECPLERYNSSMSLPSCGCRRLTPVRGSCQVAEKLFFSSPMQTCQHQLKNDICHFKESGNGFDVECSGEVCADGSTISLGDVNPETGEIDWQDFRSPKHLETHLKAVFARRMDHYGFCFIKCAIDTDKVSDDNADKVVNSLKDMDEYIMVDDVAKQMLIVPPFLQKNLLTHSSINVNILLVDSVSHSHFMRSMPETLQTLRAIRGTQVLNFELFQSMKSRTYENIQGLFSGELYDVEKPFGTQDMPPTPVNLKRLLGEFQKQGFETMYTEDVCWTWEWGLVKNLLAHMPHYKIKTRWKTFKAALKKAGVDRIDLTLASCEILQDNHHKDPFHGPPAICYNGQYQHHYILDYFGKRQKSLEENRQPFFHHTLLNVGHDDHGRRIQTLDHDLAEYVKIVSALNNTLTIILSDHGNAYGEFIKRTEEGRVEMFHPVLFMILPQGVAATLGEKRVKALKLNQQRLISILDIHYALRVLGEGKVGKLDEQHKKYTIKPDGIFSEISANRSCSQIPRIEPNVCICQDFETDVLNGTDYALIAEFALGTMNNAIQRQFRKSNPTSLKGFGACHRLVGHHFGNAKVRFNEIGDREVKMDIYVPKDSFVMEIFMVILHISNTENGGMKLITYERLTPYSPYEKCVDKGVATKLCICSTKKQQSTINIHETPSFSNYPAMFGSDTSIRSVHKQCLFIFTRKNNAGIVLEAANECRNVRYTVKIDVTTTNIIMSHKSPVRVDLWPGMMSFVVAMVQRQTQIDWDYKYTVNYGWKYVKL